MWTDQIRFFVLSLGGGLLAGAIAYAIGRRGLLLAGLRFDSPWEDFSCSTAAGLGVIALAAFGLGTAGILRPGIFAAVLALLVLLSLTRRRPRGRSSPVRGTGIHRTALIVTAILAIPLVLLPLYPPTGPDAITYHLAVARKFAASGAVSPVPEFRYAVFPEVAEMLFAGALLLGNDITAQCVSLLALAVSAAAVAAFARRLGGEPAGLWGSALLLANSSVLLLGAVAYGDMVLTAFVTVAVLSFDRWREGGGERFLAFSGLMAGLAAGTKYSALFFPPVLLAMIVAAGGRRALRPVAMFLAPCLAAALPWYLFILYHAGNPVWPFFSGVFGLRYWNETDIAAQTADLLSQYGSGKSLPSLFKLPWNLLAHGELFHTEGTLSYLLVGAVPFALYALARERSARALATVAAAYTIFWFFTAQILRYLIPVVPLYCAVAAAGAGQVLRRALGPRILPAAGAVMGFLLFLPAPYFALRFAGTTGLPPSTPGERDRFLEKRLPSYGAVRFLNAGAGSGYTLYSYHDPQMAYFTSGEFRGDFFGPWRYSRIEPALGAPESVLLDTLREIGADYLLLRDDSSASGCSQEWLTRTFVVPYYRSAGVALFRVSGVPLAPSYGAELAGTTDWREKFEQTGIRFAVTGGRMYLCTCAGSARADFANAALEISWFDGRGSHIRTDEVSGTFTAQASTVSLISTSPAHATAASLSLSPVGGAAPGIAHVSAREVRFLPLEGGGRVEQ